jgi:hypothetical protein
MAKAKVKWWVWATAGVGAYFLLKPGTANALLGTNAGMPTPIVLTAGGGILQFTGKYPVSPTGYSVVLPAGATWVGVNGVAATNARNPIFYGAGSSPAAIYTWRDSSGAQQVTTIV